MNPLMARMFPQMASNGMGNIMQIASQVSQLRQNPKGIADFLRRCGRVSEDQYAAIQKMNGDPAQIGQYLMQSGAMPQSQVMQAAKTIVPQVEKQI